MPSKSTPASGTATLSSILAARSPPPGLASPNPDADEDIDDGDSAVCHICANAITYISLSPCLHTTCHTCALRLRALYKSQSCTVCKQPQPRLLFLLPSTLPNPGSLGVTTQEDREKVFDDFLAKCPFSDEQQSTAFQSLPIKQATLQLLRFNCPFSSLHSLTEPGSSPPRGAPPTPCSFVASRGFIELARHTREQHGRLLCELCVKSKKIFAHEHVLYTPRQLVVHLPNLSTVPIDMQRGRGRRGRGRGRGGLSRGAGPAATRDVDMDNGADGEAEEEEEDMVEWSHPMCAFCRECFASSDELYAHLKEKHEECFICRNAGERDVYFLNYESLQRHFQSAHYPCPHPNCISQHFVVFPSDMDLKAHYVETHGGEMSQRELREMRELVNMFDSVPGASSVSTSSNAGQGRGGRRGRFGAQLTTAGLDGMGTPAQEDSDQAREALERQPLTDAQVTAWQALLNPLPVLPPTQLLALRSSLLAWLSHQQSAKDLLTILISLLHNPTSPTLSRAGDPDELVIKALQGLANRGKLGTDEEQELRTAINGFRAERAGAFPSLSRDSGFSAVASGRGIAVPLPLGGGGRAGPASTGRRGAPHRTVWDRVESAAQRTVPPPVALSAVPGRQQTSAQAFPALSASLAAPAPRRPGATAWSASASGSSSASPRPAPAPPPPPSVQAHSIPARSFTTTPSSVPNTPSATPRRPPPQADGRQFPGLPTREVIKVPLGAKGGNSSLRNILGQQDSSSSWGKPAGGSSWGRPLGSGSGPSSPTEATAPDGMEDGVASGGGNAPAAAGANTNGGGKKKRKGKETLFTLGSFPTA
ncbi:hypothetical protein DACRYDRAFT_118741 [Dacryopinax primogenitus]|uniref:RING-type domain-containing protein n=1 Tax=Dacryopinax primogenitus (strain DJM 731) TaxID=1858805 RepID=M5FRU5_DACPD|nr:uncharacterized protein DACRYDRAFT_118741 [Dacryopinax primogenitus]EJT98478.1 hypothetical protein DACRYDRAFT_118741 [Dacryopinax primogenitus]